MSDGFLPCRKLYCTWLSLLFASNATLRRRPPGEGIDRLAVVLHLSGRWRLRHHHVSLLYYGILSGMSWLWRQSQPGLSLLFIVGASAVRLSNILSARPSSKCLCLSVRVPGGVPIPVLTWVLLRRPTLTSQSTSCQKREANRGYLSPSEPPPSKPWLSSRVLGQTRQVAGDPLEARTRPGCSPWDPARATTEWPQGHWPWVRQLFGWDGCWRLEAAQGPAWGWHGGTCLMLGIWMNASEKFGLGMLRGSRHVSGRRVCRQFRRPELVLSDRLADPLFMFTFCTYCTSPSKLNYYCNL